MFSGATLRELDASAYEEAPPLSLEEIAEELGRTSEGGARPGSSSRSLGGQRRSLGRLTFKLPSLLHQKLPVQFCEIWADVLLSNHPVNVLAGWIDVTSTMQGVACSSHCVGIQRRPWKLRDLQCGCAEGYKVSRTHVQGCQRRSWTRR